MPRSRMVPVLPSPVPGTPPLPRLPVPERWSLPNGMRVVAVPKPGVPQVVLRLVLPAGSVADPARFPGTASLVGQLLTEGTRRLTGEELNARLDLLGAAISASVGHDFAEVEAVLLSETLAEGVSLLAEVVTDPAVPDSEVERIRAESLDGLLAREDEPANVADDRLALEVFGAEHPYGRPAFGTREGIETVSRETLVAFHASRYRPAGAFLIAAGEFDVEELRALLETTFSPWSGAAETLGRAAPPRMPSAAGRTLVLPWEDAAQSEIRVGGIGLDRRSPDWIRGAVANYVLGGSTITGRLGANLREDKGWTYGARSAFTAGLATGGWMADTAVDVAVTADAVREVLGEMRRMAEEPVAADELRRAKDALILSLPRAFETPAALASRFSTLEAYGLPHDYWEVYPAAVDAVTAADVLEIARAHWDRDRVVRVVVGAMEE